jgi:hypothetical protein
MLHRAQMSWRLQLLYMVKQAEGLDANALVEGHLSEPSAQFSWGGNCDEECEQVSARRVST